MPVAIVQGELRLLRGADAADYVESLQAGLLVLRQAGDDLLVLELDSHGSLQC